jgi:hypothetical protein
VVSLFRSSSDRVDADQPAAESAPPAPAGIQGRVLRNVVERALRAQHPRVTAHIAKIRSKEPDATPAQVIAALDRRYQFAVAGLGAVGGGIAIFPAIGTAVSLATAAAEAAAALDAAVLYTLAVAEVHSMHIEDVERRRALVLGVVMGAGGTELMRKVTGGKDRWARTVTEALPLRVLGPVNTTLGRWFVKRYVTRQLALAVGRALPFGIGVIIGGVGNVVAARTVIGAAGRAFGPPPAGWPENPAIAAPRSA